MTAPGLELVFRRDRAVVTIALLVLAAVAWAYLLRLSAGMDMTAPGDAAMGMSMPGMMAPALEPWTVADFLFMATMWIVMMLGMMTPSVAPMVLIYARVARQAAADARPFAATGWFAGGYFIAWSGLALAATGAQWLLEQLALLTPMLALATTRLGGILLIAAGIYQWTPLKDMCLSQCQAPLLFIQRHGGFRRDAPGSLRLGLRHGLYCIGCCWGLMALLFVGGIMNLLWIAAIAFFVLLEKLVSRGRLVSRLSGAALVCAGVWMLV